MTSLVTAPLLMPAPFANSTALINAISLTTNSPNASLPDGFPVITMTPLEAGGVAPSGKDFNGIFNWITQHTAWQSAGGPYTFNDSFAAEINGYPLGAVLQSNNGRSAYVSMVNGNTFDFNAIPSSIPTLWKPYAGDALIGSLAFSAEPNGYITLPGGIVLQWGTSGTVNGNVTLTFPIPFPYACFSVIATVSNASAGGNFGALEVGATNNINTQLWSAQFGTPSTGPDNASYSFNWMAIGN